MAKHSIAIALAFGFLAFTLSTVPPTSAQETGVRQMPKGAKCTWRGGQSVATGGTTCLNPRCHSDETEVNAMRAGFYCQNTLCCKKESLVTTSGSVNPCDDTVGPGYEYVQPSGQPGKCVPKKINRPIKQMGKGKAKAACEAQGRQYDPATGNCIRRMGKGKAKAECEAQGNQYDPATGNCIRRMGKGKAKAECEAQGKQYDPATGNCNRPVKQMGKGRAKAVAKYDCEAQGRQYDPETGNCNRPIKRMGKGRAKADCEDRGPRFRYDPDTGRCVKRARMSEEDKASDEEFNDEDFQPKKKKKKRKPDLDVDVDIF